MKKKSIPILLCFIVSFCSSSIAWWSTGHELTAQIAKNNLTPNALKTAKKYLKTLVTYPGSLQASKKTATYIEASNWCDVIKNYKWKNDENKKINSMFHYINPVTLPNTKVSAEHSARAVKKLLASNTELGKYNCYTALQSAIKTLLINDSSLEEKTVAFRFILHLVGDIHMPLHNAAPIINGINTLGGNKIVFKEALMVPVLTSSKKKISKVTNLHALWDSAAGLYKQLPYSYYPKYQTKAQNSFITEEAQKIVKYITKVNIPIKSIREAQIINWTIESSMLAAYFISTKKLEYFRNLKQPTKQVTAIFKNLDSYLNSAKKVCRQQIYVGGMRMAYLLNAIFDPQHADKKYINYIKTIKSDKNIPTLKSLFPNKITIL